MNDIEGNAYTTMSALNEFHLIKDGILDKDQFNYILKNPDEPKCKYTISSLLNAYQKEKRKALSLNDSSVKYKEFSKYVAANFSKQLNSDATVKLESLPKELYNKILEQIIGDN
ncbi:hypothetical protein B4U80_09859, partial [Leptotrombidium deliense]